MGKLRLAAGLDRRMWLGLAVLLGAVSCADRTDTDSRAPETDRPIDRSAETDDARQAAGQAGRSSARLPRRGDVELSGPPRLLPKEEIRAGWIQLFDGQTLFGWQSNNPPEQGGPNWRVEDGVIAADVGAPGLLLTPVQFADYDLLFDYRLQEGGNSGVFLRSVFDPQDPAVDCYELNMCDTHPQYPTGSLVGRKRVEPPVEGDGEWHTFRVRVEGDQILAQFDGRIVLDFVDDSENLRRSGYIGLQKNEGRIEFRNVRLRPLNTVPIWSGENLQGWREVPGSQARFDRVEGAIHVNGGPGFLETEPTFGDFVLQFEAITHNENANSGVFFRAMKGTEENPSGGYELQISNKFADGDRTKPNDYGRGFGTGAIMHRAPARYIVADDDQWFTVTLVADGPRFASWVDGFPVMHWLDGREPHENPRRGRRLEAGHISLQGHDPATDVRFRNLRIAEGETK